MRFTTALAVSAALTVAGLADPAAAHHSFAMFDMAKTVTFKGVVKQVQWANPHVWVEMAVDEGGTLKAYSFEAGAVAVLKRAGWAKDTLKVGDSVSIVTHPFKNGRTGGSLQSVTLANGRTLSAADAIPGALLAPTQK